MRTLDKLKKKIEGKRFEGYSLFNEECYFKEEGNEEMIKMLYERDFEVHEEEKKMEENLILKIEEG